MVRSIQRLIANAAHGATKVCRNCRTELPIKLFLSNRHRVCTPCRLRAQARSLEFQLGVVGIDPNEPIVPVAGITSTPEGYRKYMRDYMRNKRGTNDRDPPLRPKKTKFCMVCKHYKLARDFANFTVRTCLRCDREPPRIP